MTTSTIAPSTVRRTGVRQLLAYAAVCFLLGSNWPAVRVLVRDVPPLRAVGLGYAVACVVTMIAGWHTRRLRPRSGLELRNLLVMGLTLLAVPTAVISWAEQYINASLTAVIYASLPLAVALIVRITMGQRVPLRAVIAMVIGALGIVVLFFDGVPQTPIGRVSALAVAGSVFVCAWGVIYASKAPANLTSYFSIGLQFGMNAVLVLAASAILEHGRASNWNTSSLASFYFIALFCTALMVLLYYWLLKEIATFQVATIDLVVPVVSFLEGVLFLKEAVTAVMIAAAIVVLGATAYVLRSTQGESA